MATIAQMKSEIKAQKPRSAWGRGVQKYALELLDNAKESLDYRAKYSPRTIPTNWTEFRKMLLNGASDWKQYSWGACSLIYNEDIAKRLCSPSEYKKSNRGERKPNAREEWLDTQARALYQAAELIRKVY